LESGLNPARLVILNEVKDLKFGVGAGSRKTLQRRGVVILNEVKDLSLKTWTGAEGEILHSVQDDKNGNGTLRAKASRMRNKGMEREVIRCGPR
jgi:hypothetical protein